MASEDARSVNPGSPLRIAIQGELGSNSHMAALGVFAAGAVEIVACSLSAEVFERLADGAFGTGGSVDEAVLPIENSLHGSVAEHYDLLLHQPVAIVGESLLRVRHDVIAAPGVRPAEIRRVLSHPVALSQCRRWLAAHPGIEAVPFYDTAGSVKHVMAERLRDTAGIAPALAARQYGAEIVVAGIEDHAENYTRFYRLVATRPAIAVKDPDKLSVAFSVAHRPGTLMLALEEFRKAGLNLTRIESRPVPGRPWEYVFFVDVRFETAEQIDGAMAGLARHCQMVKELGRYRAADRSWTVG
jgi:prephenate dehydratase